MKHGFPHHQNGSTRDCGLTDLWGRYPQESLAVLRRGDGLPNSPAAGSLAHHSAGSPFSSGPRPYKGESDRRTRCSVLAGCCAMSMAGSEPRTGRAATMAKSQDAALLHFWEVRSGAMTATTPRSLGAGRSSAMPARLLPGYLGRSFDGWSHLCEPAERSECPWRCSAAGVILSHL